MKNIDNLLQRYSEGTITPEEQDELNRLTRRDEVFHAAEAEAHTIRRRRRATASTVAAVLIVAGVLFTILPQNRLSTGDAPLIAQAEPAHAALASTSHPKPSKAIETLDNAIEPLLDPDPIVACNTQCSPDSVINDIWNFLRA